MTDKSRFGITGSGAVLGVGVFALGAAVIGVAVNNSGAPEVVPEVAVLEAPETTEAAPESVETPTPEVAVESAEEEVSEDVSAEEVAEAEPEQEVEAEAEAVETPTEEPPTPLEGPKFDVVRIDPFGSAVIAGTAAPGARVVLSADGEAVANAVADGNGKYVALFDLPASTDPRSLSAEMTTVEGVVVPSSGTVLIAPTKPVEVADVAPEAEAEAEEVTQDAEETPLETADEPEPDVAEQPVETTEAEVEAEEDPVAATEVESAAEEPAEVEVAEVEAEPAAEPEVEAAPEPEAEPASPAIVLADESGVTVLQPAPQPAVPTNDPVSDVAPDVAANLVIDTITYDTSGDVALSGRGDGASFARVYLNDKAVQTVKIEDDGTWRTPLPDVDAGVYRLRIDEVTSEGTVTSRVETPFQREEPEVVAEAAQRPNAVTVQEGFTLWAIARERFGDGTQFVRVYEANRDLIRDPDLIYPGQIFELPEG